VEIEMGSKIFLVFLVLFIFAITENTWGQVFYKWIDEKGTVHFSENPPTVIPKNQDKGQDKNQVKSQDKNQVKKQDKSLDKQTTKENSLEILKGLEVGNRIIPEDMRKYGPAG
jgi:hypothetical protein